MNVLMIVVDALRPDVLPIYGGNLNTPNINRLRSHAVLFQRHFTQTATTLPSHASLFTSLYPREHGVLQNGAVIDSNVPTLASRLQSEGYDTAGFISAAVLHSDYQINKGFDVWKDDMVSRHDVNRIAGPKILSDEVTERAIDWLANRTSARPFFAFIHYFDPHTPENVPEPWLSMYPRKRYLLEQILYHKLGYKHLAPHKILAKRNGWYDGAVSYTDHWLGQLLEWLRVKGLYDNTLIIFTADHGEANGDHSWVTHAAFMYDEIIHVPLLLKLPNQTLAGHTVTGLTEHIDLMPTILESLGMQSANNNLSGQSFWLSLITKQRVGKEYIFGQRQYYEPGHELVDLQGNSHIVSGPMFCVRTERHKYIFEENGSQELYDLLHDPGELRDISNLELNIVNELAAILKEWKNSHPARYESNFHGEEITRQRLRALGYLD